MKKFSIYLTALVLLIFGLSACDFGDTNVDPSSPLDTPPLVSLIPAAQVQTAYIIGGDMGRYNGVFTQHYAGVGRQHLVIGRYGLSESDVNTTWNQLYAGALNDLNIAINTAGAESPHYSGLAKVLIATILGNATDCWGNIPYSDAIKGEGSLNPSYDTRDQIYTSIHTLLSEAISELGESSSVLSPGSDDLYFGGDLDKWIAVANTLDARYYLHRGEYDNALAAAKKGIASNAGDFQFNFGESATEQNPLYQFQDQRAGDLVMGEYFVNLMKDIADPRLPYFADKDDDGAYTGAPAGVSTAASLPGTYYASKSSPVILASYVENQFIMAEANLKKAAPDNAAAATALNTAIDASVTKITGSSDAAFLAAESETAGTVSETAIMTHKYIALFSQTETWNDIRRTGIPALTVAKNNTLDDVFPERWAYPQGERDFNQENWKANTPSEDVTAVLKVKLSWD